jgi:parallel beta-helix repeat protein
MFCIAIKSAGAVIRRVPQDYSTIQAAINAANAGDTILVAPGTYPEYVLVNKSVTLMGTDRQSIITGAASPLIVIEVKASNVKICNFTIIGPTSYHHGIWVESPSPTPYENVQIINNAITGCHHAIYLGRCTRCLIANNTLNRNGYGVRLYDSRYNAVTENFINATIFYSINFYTRSSYNNITKNTITNGVYGVLLEYSNYTYMYLNTIKTNAQYGIRFSYSYYSLIVGNTVQKNKYGIYIWNCSNNQFYYNNFIENTNQVTHYAVPVTSNTWDNNRYPLIGTKGNYWSDYTGVDDGSGRGRWNETRYQGDGVGDTLIPHLQVDWYPLMFPWTPVPLVKPVAIFTWSPIEPLPNTPVTFNASKSYSPRINGTIVLYFWNFGDTNLTSTTNPIIVHTYANPGNYTVVLKVTDDYGYTNSTSHVVTVREFKLEIDVYTQQPEPYSGRGPNMPSDAFSPQSLVILYAEVTYNYEPVENKQVVFTIRDPNGVEILRTNNTDANGFTMVSFRLASNATFGLYHVLASVEVSGRIANDTLTFLMGWIIEVINVTTLDQYGAPKDSFIKGDEIYFSVDLKNIAFTTRNATLTVGIYDNVSQIIGATFISLEVPPGLHEYNLVFNVKIPVWSAVENASAHICAFTTWPWNGGVAYCPEVSTTFRIAPH